MGGRKRCITLPTPTLPANPEKPPNTNRNWCHYPRERRRPASSVPHDSKRSSARRWNAGMRNGLSQGEASHGISRGRGMDVARASRPQAMRHADQPARQGQRQGTLSENPARAERWKGSRLMGGTPMPQVLFGSHGGAHFRQRIPRADEWHSCGAGCGCLSRRPSPNPEPSS